MLWQRQAVTLPAVVYHVISRAHDGDLDEINDHGEIRIQLDAHADTRAEADAVTDAIVARLKALCLACPTTIGAGSAVCDVEIVGPVDLTEPPDDGSDEWEYIGSVDALLYLG